MASLMDSSNNLPAPDFLEVTQDWPTKPGVYTMKDPAGKILYIGKAKSLRHRIRSYFQRTDQLPAKTRVLVKKVQSLEFQVTHTELEALLLECNLIKKHRPRYNIRLKDDKNFPYVVLDFTHTFPVFRTTRRVHISPQLRYFGPYSGGVRDISRFLLKAFQIRDCSEAKFKNRTRPCLNYEIGICTAPCVNLVSQEDYARQIQDAILFLKGKTEQLLKRLTEEMHGASESMQYERAKILRDRIQNISRLNEKQNIVLVNQRQDVDVIGYYDAGNEIQWAVLFLRGGFLTGRRLEKTPIPLIPEERFEQFLNQFYDVSLIPDEVWVAEEFENRESLQDLLSQKSGKRVQVRVRRGESGMRLLGMAHENARLIYHENLKSAPKSGSVELQKALGLAEAPQTIEGIDVSNFQGTSPAIALVHFADERPLKSRYRLYYPKTVDGQNDFAMIHEVVTRRFSKPEPPWPDLLLIDGGKGQLQSAVRALEELGVSIPVCALAKARTESSFTRKEIKKVEDRIFIPNRKNPINLKPNDPALNLLQQVRDEAHRFSVKNHQRRRTQHALTGSNWDSLQGVGVKSKALLIQKFADWEKLLTATLDEIQSAGISAHMARKIMDQLHPTSVKGEKTSNTISGSEPESEDPESDESESEDLDSDGPDSDEPDSEESEPDEPRSDE
jgi:excinuclease ABC subunit C